MNESDLQVIVQEVMRRMFGENDLVQPAPASNGAPNRNSASAQDVSKSATEVVSSVITRNEIVEFARAGKKRLVVQHGGLVTPLARDLAAENGIEIVFASDSASAGVGNGSTRAFVAGYTHTHGADPTQFACLRCSSCLEPAFYERALREMEQTTTRVLGELRVFIQSCWLSEPADIATLRNLSKPPMGNLPCCFYANFNLFWAGENLQVCRQIVKDGVLPVPVVNQMVARLLERHAARLEKWSLAETVALVRMLVQYFNGKGPATSEEFLAIVEHALIALDRVQSWIDGLLPWSELDARLALRRPIAMF